MCQAEDPAFFASDRLKPSDSVMAALAATEEAGRGDAPPPWLHALVVCLAAPTSRHSSLCLLSSR